MSHCHVPLIRVGHDEEDRRFAGRGEKCGDPAAECQVLLLHCKKRLAVFPSPAGMSLDDNIPGQGEFGK